MKEPAFWRTDGGRGSGALARALLSPLGWLYAWAVARRIRRATPVRIRPKVVCIGNLTVGGTGKTPVTQTLMQRLAAMDITTVSLSRGYGGAEAGPLQVDPDQHAAADVGDEPLLLASSGQAWIARDRAAGGQAIDAAGGIDLVLMDDGHQNPDLAKDCSIIVVDGVTGWGPGTIFPAGPLREPVKAGLARADAVIVMMPDEDSQPDWAGLGLADLEIPAFHAWLEPVAPPPPGKLVAFAGIGRPQKFFDALQAAGGDLGEVAVYGDHHSFTAGDIRHLDALASAHDAQLVTTEKDWVRLPPDIRARVTAWPVRAVFANPGALDGLLRDIVDGAANAG
ncbi:tetraacyldisaccharide 4'-kinase [Maricaulis maris]|uniref:Tetraacyldisaccharide 4'-kinase n=1 Tax=Maricaulis maris TaxID=74318 RepID=A0A495DM70_9PROT|nr:tetraacyldisaccharide 4'-kinase [Maricaulis maris]RKR04005.1 lipid-A-disaccharide kinase [Maricaulis maris]